MDKIVIIGSPGAGKSVLARDLGKILDIEVFHLDRYFWQPGWKEHPRETRLLIQQELLQGKDQWLIEGTYLGSSDDRLNAADTIIFLDMPCLQCLWRIFKRHIQYRNRSRPDIPDGCTDRLTVTRILKVLVFPFRGRNHFLAKMRDIRAREMHQPGKKTILTYRSSEQARNFLLKLQAARSSEKRTCPCHEHECRCAEKPAPMATPETLFFAGRPNRI